MMTLEDVKKASFMRANIIGIAGCYRRSEDGKYWVHTAVPIYEESSYAHYSDEDVWRSTSQGEDIYELA